jgi:hypothetical protein
LRFSFQIRAELCRIHKKTYKYPEKCRYNPPAGRGFWFNSI